MPPQPSRPFRSVQLAQVSEVACAVRSFLGQKGIQTVQHTACVPRTEHMITHTHAWSIIWQCQCLMHGINLTKLYANNCKYMMYMHVYATYSKHMQTCIMKESIPAPAALNKWPEGASSIRGAVGFFGCSDLLCLPDLLGDNSEPPFGETVLSHPLNQHLPWVTQKVFPSFFLSCPSCPLKSVDTTAWQPPPPKTTCCSSQVLQGKATNQSNALLCRASPWGAMSKCATLINEH